MDPKLWWHLSRASGLTAWALLAGGVLWGLVMAGRLTRSPSRAWQMDVHRFLGGFSLVFIALHLVTLVLDDSITIGIREILIPFTARYRPGAVAAGAAASDLVLAGVAPSWLRRRVPHRWWQWVHWLSYPLFALVSVHAFAAGTDTDALALRWVALVIGAVLLFVATYRGLRRPTVSGPRRSPAHR